MSSSQRTFLEEDRDRCLRAIESCDRDMKRVPRLGWLALVVVPAAWFLGPLGALGSILAVGGLIAFSIYLVSGHREDYRSRLREIERKLKSLERPSPP
ncbi:MAG: hypothetical protein AAFX94_21240 [Myxococcota bacterium]